MDDPISPEETTNQAQGAKLPDTEGSEHNGAKRPRRRRSPQAPGLPRRMLPLDRCVDGLRRLARFPDYDKYAELWLLKVAQHAEYEDRVLSAEQAIVSRMKTIALAASKEILDLRDEKAKLHEAKPLSIEEIAKLIEEMQVVLNTAP